MVQWAVWGTRFEGFVFCFTLAMTFSSFLPRCHRMRVLHLLLESTRDSFPIFPIQKILIIQLCSFCLPTWSEA